MTTIVTRAGKGSALTWTEGDSNFTNLNTDKMESFTAAGDSGTSQIISGSNTLTIAGGTNLNSVASATDTITVNLDTTVTGLTSLTSATLVTDTINGSTANSPIVIAPDGTGDVHLNTDSVRIGDNNADATIVTRGTGDLILTTNEGSGTEGIIRIYDGAGGNITITPNGAGSIVLNEAGTGATVSRRSASTGTISNAIIAQRNYTADVLANMDGHSAAIAFGVRDSAAASSTFSRIGGEYATDGNHAFFFEMSGNSFTSATRIAMLAAGSLILGTPSTSTAQTLTTIDTQDLVLNTNFGTNSGSITITDAANGNITITPNGTGSIVLDGVNWPQADGTNGQSLITNGAGQLSWSTVSGGGGGLANVVEDLSPQLGGDLDVLTRIITTSTTNGNISLTPNGSGVVYLNCDTVSLGISSAFTAFVGTQGTNDLTLVTGNGTNSGNITIYNGVNENIALTPNGTGKTATTNLTYNEAVYTAGSTTGTITPDCANGSIQSITLTGSITFNAFANPISGQTLTLIIKQPVSGGPYTLTSTMLFAGVSKTLSTASTSIDILTVSYIGTVYYASLAKGFA